MSIWFKGSIEINGDIQQAKEKLTDLGEHFTQVISLMPGLTKVELVEQGEHFVTLRTNEGIMERKNIVIRNDAERIEMEFDEEYHAGRLVTTTSHIKDEFLLSQTGLVYQTTISNVKASGFLGFFYKMFGKSSIGNAFLKSYKSYFENETSDKKR